jgi:hypothetical protein
MLNLSDMRHPHHQYLRELEILQNSKNLSPAEVTAFCLVPQLLKNSTSFQRSPLLDEKPSSSPIMEFLRLYSWKGKSIRIRQSLFRWHRGQYPLVLWDHIPNPFELLKIQAEGKRVITVFKTALEWEQIHLGKDAWNFIAHDLIHADHFFQNSELRQGQIQFYQKLLDLWNHNLITLARKFCTEQFEYLISDMNSHPQHLKQTLSAICLIAWKKSRGQDLKQRLSTQDEILFQEQIHHLLTAFLLR